MELSSLLAMMVEKGASDLFLSVGAPPMLKIEGHMARVGHEALTAQTVHQLVYSVLEDSQAALYEGTNELNYSLRINAIGRFRINVFRQMGEIAFVARHVHDVIPSIEALGLPAILKTLIMQERGLLLLVGGTGTGKSTTMASMLDYRNQHRSGHILTIEDPVEYVHKHQQSLVNQREVGIDTESYEVALKNAMREAPNVIMIGEIRDQVTMKSAITYAETGHLCVSTLHANSAPQALERILNFFPDTAQKQLLQDLSSNIVAIVSQRLPSDLNNKRVAAVEVMLNTPYIQELIAQGNLSKIRDAMVQARETGCQTLDDALYKLVVEGKISPDEAMRHADSRTNLSLRFKLEGTGKQAFSDIRKDVSYARNAPFGDYTTFQLTRYKVTEEHARLQQPMERAIRVALTAKGMTEVDKDADVDVQYALSTSAAEYRRLPEIENAVKARINLDDECGMYGSLSININDLHTSKSVWQMLTSLKFAVRQEDVEIINKDVQYLLSQFPPSQQWQLED